MTALQQQGLDLSGLSGTRGRGARGDITTDDVVNGHCEKTLALLWRTIAHWRLGSGSLVSESILRQEIVQVRAAHSKEARTFETAQINADKADAIEIENEFGTDDNNSNNGNNGNNNNDSLLESNSTARLLLEWTRAVCAGSRLRVPVRNFTTSFADGRALCALLNFYHPQLLSTGDMQTTTADLASSRGSRSKKISKKTVSSSSCIDTWNPELLASGDITQQEYKHCLEGERANFELFNKAIRLIGSVPPMLGEHDTDHLPEEKIMVIVIAHVCARVLQSSKEIHACLRIQASWRHSLERRRLAVMHRAARTLVRAFRQRDGKSRFRQFRTSVVLTQSKIRCMLQRNKYIRYRSSIVALQGQSRSRAACVLVASERQVFVTLAACSKKVHQARRNYYVRKEEWASITINALVLGFQTRKKYLFKKNAVRVLQKNTRRFIAVQQHRALQSATLCMQSMFRGNSARTKATVRYNSIVVVQNVVRRKLAMELRRATLRAVVSLQCAVRVSFASQKSVTLFRQRYALKEKSATCIQSLIRGRLSRLFLSLSCTSATTIQSFVRKVQGLATYQHVRSSVVTCQAAMRGTVARVSFLALRKAAVSIQCVVRSFISRRQLRLLATAWDATQEAAATTLQKIFRRRFAMNTFQTSMDACIVLQSIARTFHAVSVFRTAVRSVVTLQSFVRSKYASQKFTRCKMAAISIQSIWRRFKAHRKYQQMIQAAIQVQAFTRCVQTRVRFVHTIASIVILQKMGRCYLANQEAMARKNLRKTKEIASATAIQTTYRTFSNRQKWNTTLAACLRIQNIIRMSLAVRRFKTSLAAIVSIQSIGRTYLKKSSYTSLRTAVITMQSAWRCYKMRSNFQEFTAAAVIVQSFVRGVQTKSWYTQVVTSIITVQCAMRTFLSQKQTSCLRQQRNADHYAATQIAATYRGFVKRKQFLHFRIQVVALQSQYRSSQATKQFTQLLSATVTIQANARRHSVRNRLQHHHQQATRVQASIRRHLQRQEFGRAKRAKRAAIRIQCASRCIVSKKTVRFIRATVLVQKCVRKWKAMSNMAQTRQACLLVQSHVRRRTARNVHVSKTSIATRIATLHRSRSQRTKYLNGKSAIVTLQSLHRRTCAQKTLQSMKQQQAYYIAHRRSMERSARKIQNTYRSMVVYRAQTSAVVILQFHVRCFLKQMYDARVSQSIGFVQAFWRGCIARSRSTKSLNAMRERIQSANANASDEMKLGNRTSAALQVLLRSKALSEVFDSIKTLEVSTRLSSVCCSCFAQEIDAVPIIYGLMRSCNRSQPHRKLLLHALRVLNNVWPFEMKIARGNASNLAPEFEPRMEILVDLMQVGILNVVVLFYLFGCFLYLFLLFFNSFFFCFFFFFCHFFFFFLYFFV